MSIRHYKRSWWNHKYVILLLFSCFLHKIQTTAYRWNFWIMHSLSALFDVVTPPLSCSFSYLYPTQFQTQSAGP